MTSSTLDSSTKKTRIYIGNISEQTSETDINDLCREFGTVVSVKLKKGYGFVEFEESDAALQAMSKLNLTMFRGRKINVNFARYRSSRSRSRSPSPTNSSQPSSTTAPYRYRSRSPHGRYGRYSRSPSPFRYSTRSPGRGRPRTRSRSFSRPGYHQSRSPKRQKRSRSPSISPSRRSTSPGPHASYPGTSTLDEQVREHSMNYEPTGQSEGNRDSQFSVKFKIAKHEMRPRIFPQDEEEDDQKSAPGSTREHHSSSANGTPKSPHSYRYNRDDLEYDRRDSDKDRRPQQNKLYSVDDVSSEDDSSKSASSTPYSRRSGHSTPARTDSGVEDIINHRLNDVQQSYQKRISELIEMMNSKLEQQHKEQVTILQKILSQESLREKELETLRQEVVNVKQLFSGGIKQEADYGGNVGQKLNFETSELSQKVTESLTRIESVVKLEQEEFRRTMLQKEEENGKQMETLIQEVTTSKEARWKRIEGLTTKVFNLEEKVEAFNVLIKKTMEEMQSMQTDTFNQIQTLGELIGGTTIGVQRPKRLKKT